MLKLAIFALFAIVACNAVITGNFRKADVDDTVKEIANWATSKMSGLTGVNGAFNVDEILEVRTQVVAGVNYQLKVRYSIVDENNNNSVS